MAAAKRSASRFGLPELGRKTGRRPARVADNIKNEVAAVLLRKIRDPRVSGVSITEVETSPDLRKAWIYFTVLKGDRIEVAAGLDSAKGFIRSHLARVLGMRYVPDIEFRLDETIDKMAEMDRLFQEIAKEDDQSAK